MVDDRLKFVFCLFTSERGTTREQCFLGAVYCILVATQCILTKSQLCIDFFYILRLTRCARSTAIIFILASQIKKVEVYSVNEKIEFWKASCFLQAYFGNVLTFSDSLIIPQI